MKLHFLKTKIQNRIYRDFEHHFLTNFGKIIFLKIPYIWKFYGFFQKKKTKKNKKTKKTKKHEYVPKGYQFPVQTKV